MRQLTALDTQFLSTESATTAAHVAGVAILADPVTRADLVTLLNDRAHLAPPLRMRLQGLPFGLDRPYWVDDPDTDAADHVYETTLPAPGDDRQLAEVVAALHARRLDRSRPLWEMHLIHGLSGGRTAVYTKIHHAAIDGVSGVEILGAMLDLSPEVRQVEPAAETITISPDLRTMLAGAVGRTMTQPVRVARSLARTVGDLDAIPLAASLPGARKVAGMARRFLGVRPAPTLPPLAAPRTPFNGPISADRVMAYGTLPLDEVKRIAKDHGMSVNDVVMALCASALRAWLRDEDALPDRPLVAAVPVSVRTARGTMGNQISVMLAPLPTDVADAGERLRTTRATMARVKRRFAASPTTWLNDVCGLLPAPVSALATPAVFRLASRLAPAVNLIVSNVPGPQFPLWMCGARVLAYHPLSVITDISGALSVTCLSYDGRLDIGIVACPSRVPDPWAIIDHLESALEELAEAELTETELTETEPTETEPTATVGPDQR
ncbi:wax ester/triacylglycerol synthase family O-acyltransferase [Streptosporangiaceae bacterium NEAU-GS5]|nr:wax ester/triacylglycerol synthase family O-acyltransferase [Streptosporangiaceae bacterium NEAU-GS5]